MIIRENDWSVGSLSPADPNSQSFKSPNQGHGGSKKWAAHGPLLVEDDKLSLETRPAYRFQTNSADAKVGEAVALSQTEDAFLLKVQEALQRMNELSVLAQSASQSNDDRLAGAAEFARLQDSIKDIESKMFAAVKLFDHSNLETTAVGDVTGMSATPIPFMGADSLMIIETTSNPAMISIQDATSASAAVNAINGALRAVADLRVKFGTSIQNLNLNGWEAVGGDGTISVEHGLIRDITVAEENTRVARYDILLQSSTAMLAQANALPQSALRLLLD